MTDDVFEISTPSERFVKIGDKRVDILINLRIGMNLFSFLKKREHKLNRIHTNAKGPVMKEDLAEIVSTVCERSAPEFTKEWFMKNYNSFRLNKLLYFIFKPYVKKLKTHISTTEAKSSSFENGLFGGLFGRLFNLLRKIEESILIVLETLIVRQAIESAPIGDNSKNAHKIALDDENTQWILASFRSKRRRGEEPLGSMSDFFSYSIRGDCSVCL